MLSVPELANAVATAQADIVALIRGGGSDEQFGVFEHPELLRTWSGKRAYRVVGIGHSANSTALDLLSEFAATTPAAAGAHIADALRALRTSQQQVSELHTQNDELRLQLRHIRMEQAAQPQPAVIPLLANCQRSVCKTIPGLHAMFSSHSSSASSRGSCSCSGSCTGTERRGRGRIATK